MVTSLLILALGARAQEAPVEIFVSDDAGEVEVSVRATGRPVFIPGCRAIGWERFDDATKSYVPIEAAPCGPLTAAVQVDSKGLTLLEAPSVTGFQVLRPVLVYGTGCRPGLPLPLADCDNISALVGPYAPLRGASAPAK